jgi:hypothetical protein
MAIIGAPLDVCRTLVRTLGLGLQGYEEVKPEVFKIKLIGSPFYADGEDAVQAKVVTVTLLEAFESEGYSLYSSFKVNFDIWIFSRDTQWSKGLPVYQS